MKGFLLPRILAVSLTLMTLFAFLVFRTGIVRAAAGSYFGGMEVFTLTCTCTGNTLIYIQDYGSQGELALVYQEGEARLFANDNPYGNYLLGSYTPGAGTCEIEAGEDCVEMESDGVMDSNPGVGTTSS